MKCPKCSSINTKKIRSEPKIAKTFSRDPRVEPKFTAWIYICKDCNNEFKVKL